MVIIRLIIIVILGLSTVHLHNASLPQFFEKEVGAWHFHTYFFEVQERSIDEMIKFRKALRQNIDDGTFPECSLNRINVGFFGPHAVSQFELCCNKTSFAVAHSFHTLNHGNLSVLIHPLTVLDREDHSSRKSFIGEDIILYLQTPLLYDLLPKPRPCPKYPYFSDEVPESKEDYSIPINGTEDYRGENPNFNILTDPY